MKLATWNVNSLKVRLPQVIEYLAVQQPDVMCLQETKLEDDKFPVMELTAAGYQSLVQWRTRRTRGTEYSLKTAGARSRRA